MEKFPTLVFVPSPVFPLADLVPVTPIVGARWLGTGQLEAASPYNRCCNCQQHKQQGYDNRVHFLLHRVSPAPTIVRSVPFVLARIAILEPPKVPPSARPVRVPLLQPPRRTKGYFLLWSVLDKGLICSVLERSLVL